MTSQNFTQENKSIQPIPRSFSKFRSQDNSIPPTSERIVDIPNFKEDLKYNYDRPVSCGSTNSGATLIPTINSRFAAANSTNDDAIHIDMPKKKTNDLQDIEMYSFENDEPKEEYLSLREMFDKKELLKIHVWRQACAEFVGTLCLEFWIGAVVVGTLVSDFTLKPFLIGFGHLPILTLLILVIGPISGAHINPLFTFATMFTRLMSVPRGLVYIAFQIAGGTVGALLLKAVTSSDYIEKTNLGLCNFDSKKINAGDAMLAEAIFDFGLLMVLFLTAFDPYSKKNFSPKVAAFIIGSTFATLAWLSGGINSGWGGASLNPVKCFAYSVALSDFSDHWAFWVAPLLASSVYALIYNILAPYAPLSSTRSRRNKTVRA
ncbi:hypothetical protein G9A89_009212 [Geosiphon pyriformis]|nr:hypothetical protein G9A89_009212 [Geosiphon pyriformis]